MDYYNNPHRHNSLYQFAYNNARDMGSLTTAAALVLAIIIGLNVTSHMHGRKAAIFYNSIPIKRLNLFATYYLSGLIYFMPAFFASYIMSALIMPFGSAIIINTQYYLGAFFFFLLVYSFIILCANIAGTAVNSLLAAFYFCAVLPAIFFTFLSFTSLFYRFTNLYAMADGPLWQFIYYPVITFFPNVFGAYNNLGVFDCILMLVFAAGLTCLAYLFNRLTKTENAAKPFYFSKFLAVSKHSVLAILVILAGMLFYLASNSILFLIIGIIIGGFLAFLLVNLIIYKNMREVFRGIKQFLILALCASLLAGLISTDIFGVDTHIPDASRTQYIYFYQWGNLLSYDFSRETQNHRAQHDRLSLNRIIIEDTDTMQLVNNIFEAALKSERRPSGSAVYSSDFMFEWTPLDAGNIYYRLRGGGIWAKQLWISSLRFNSQQDRNEFDAAINNLAQSPGYIQALYYPLTSPQVMREQLDASERFSVELSRMDGTTVFSVAVTREQMEALLDAINEDIEAMPALNISNWQYYLTLVFRDSDGYLGYIGMIINEQDFALTDAFLFDELDK